MIHFPLGRRVFLPGEPAAYLVCLIQPRLVFRGSLIDISGKYTEIRVNDAHPGENGKYKTVKPAGQYKRCDTEYQSKFSK